MDQLALFILIGACAGGTIAGIVIKAGALPGLMIAASFTLAAGIVSLHHELAGWVAGALAAAVCGWALGMRGRRTIMIVLGTLMGAFAGVALSGVMPS